MTAVDDGYEEKRQGGMDDALDEVEPEDRQPPTDEEAEQDDYANTDARTTEGAAGREDRANVVFGDSERR